MTHELKCWPSFYEALESNSRKFEIRKDDRGFKVGDDLLLREYSTIDQEYSGRSLTRTIAYITDYAQTNGRVVMSLF